MVRRGIWIQTAFSLDWLTSSGTSSGKERNPRTPTARVHSECTLCPLRWSEKLPLSSSKATTLHSPNALALHSSDAMHRTHWGHWIWRQSVIIRWSTFGDFPRFNIFPRGMLSRSFLHFEIFGVCSVYRSIYWNLWGVMVRRGIWIQTARWIQIHLYFPAVCFLVVS